MHWNKGLGIIGVQWGDEGKGKIVDHAAENADVVVRYKGGNNAGHTLVVNNKKSITHIVPSGILRPDVYNVVAHGVVIDPQILCQEIEEFTAQGVSMDRLVVSDSAHVIMRYHRDLDILEEVVIREDAKKIGTTRRGIGPTYADQKYRVGILMQDLYKKDILGDKISHALERVNVLFRAFGVTKEKYLELFAPMYAKDHGETDFSYYTDKGYDIGKLVERYHEYGNDLVMWTRNTIEFLQSALDSKKQIIFEGAQGVLLDVELGTYPFCTSSNVGVGGILDGTGINYQDLTKVIGVVKAYMTRVGTGPYPTRLDHKWGTGKHLLTKGAEFGATTGRPRPCGWFDAIATKYALGRTTNEIAITKLDVLDELKKIYICLSYDYNGPDTFYDGKPLKKGDELTHFPTDKQIQMHCIPGRHYEQDGWQQSIRGITKLNDLPFLAKRYIDTLAGLCGAKPLYISTGPGREETIEL